jgi:hypothetical protein
VRPNSAKGDPLVQSHLAKAEASGIHKIVAIEKLQTLPANIDELKAVLQSGSDVWIAMKIGETWMGKGPGRDGVIPDWSQGNLVGGHAIVMSGYRKLPNGKHQFLIHNSWGDSWADHGYGWVNENMVSQFMNYAYKVKLDESGAKVTEITDDDCAEDELVDSVSGQCAKICADDSRPAGGKCGGDSSSASPKPKK